MTVSEGRGHPIRRIRSATRNAIGWSLASTRRRRTAFYSVVVGLIVAANSGFLGIVLRALQFDESTAEKWEQAIRNDTLSLVALLVVAAYVDAIVRREDTERRQRDQEQLHRDLSKLIDGKLSTSLDRANERAMGSLAKMSPTVFEPLINQAIRDPLKAASPRLCVDAALTNVLKTHPESYTNLIDGILSSNQSLIIDNAKIKFVLRDVEGGDYIQIDYAFVGTIRRPVYRLMLAHDEFRSETKILTTGDLTDAWFMIDEVAYRGSLGLADGNSAELKYRNSAGAWITERRKFALESGSSPHDEDGTHIVWSVDLAPPVGISIEECEVSIRTSVILPRQPPGLRWFFDNPIYVEEITFDVAQLWPNEKMDFILYPFLLGTEDYTQRSSERQPIYRIGIHNWLSRGHGVMLIWEHLTSDLNQH